MKTMTEAKAKKAAKLVAERDRLRADREQFQQVSGLHFRDRHNNPVEMSEVNTPDYICDILITHCKCRIEDIAAELADL